MKKALIFLTLSLVILMCLVACGGEVTGKQVPIYEGMTVSPTTEVASVGTKVVSLVSYKKSTKKTDLDPEGCDYYADLGEEIYINVHIHNPDEFEILSFTLNGEKYSSYMFEDGSNMETIIIKCNVGNESGTKEYTIDAIKYVDKQAIKNVILEGDKTITIHISNNEYVPEAPDITPACTHDDQSKIVIIEGKNATCTNTGLTEGKKCGNCGEILIPQNVIPAKGHKFGEWITVKEATVDENGLRERHCHCGEADTQITDKIPTSKGLKYTLNDDGKSYSVTGIGTCTDKEIIIPKEYNGLPITCIGEYAFYCCESIESVTIPDSVKSIEAVSFATCDSLKKVTIPNSVTSIGNSAFSDCISLVEITIPDSLESIGSHVFFRCDKLPYNIYDNALYLGNENNPYIVLVEVQNKENLKNCRIHNNTKFIYYAAFTGCTSLTSITIPDSVISIGENAFCFCTSLTSIIIPDSVISIGVSAFSSCTLLANVKMSNCVTNIGNFAFAGCTALTNITIPDTVTKISDGVFYDCSSLECITLSQYLESIGDHAFSGCDLLENITIPNYVTSIGIGAFCDCSSIQNIEIPNSVTYIGYGAFAGCSALKTIFIPNGVTSIGRNTFYLCKALSTVELGCSLTSIGDLAFGECSSITYVNIPDSVTSIGENAFYRCTSLTSIIIPDSVTHIGRSAFYDCCSLTSVSIPNSVTSIAASMFSKCTSLRSVTIPDTVTSIGERAFDFCTSLKNVLIPDSVTYISDNAFLGCYSLQYNEYDNALYLGNENNPYIILIKAKDESITSCDIYSTTKFIHEDAFYNCKSLTSIIIPDGVTNIAADTFYGCSSLQSITIPNSVTSIDGGAFYGCTSLKHITIPNSVTRIVSGAFTGCLSLRYNSCNGAKYLGNDDNPYYALIKADNINMTACELEDRTKIIADGAFSDCTLLVYVLIPNSVTNIGAGVFNECVWLTSVNFLGTIEEWNQITNMGNWKAYYLPDTTTEVICFDGTVTIE